jgi:hypothetical protein
MKRYTSFCFRFETSFRVYLLINFVNFNFLFVLYFSLKCYVMQYNKCFSQYILRLSWLSSVSPERIPYAKVHDSSQFLQRFIDSAVDTTSFVVLIMNH